VRPCFPILCCINFLFTVAAAQTHLSPREAFGKAAETQRPVLLIFSGSDWCLPCIRLHKKIFSDSSFKRYAAENLVVLEADFPQQKKIPAEEANWNEELAKEFNPDGVFPYLLLLKPDRSVVTLLQYENYSVDAFINQVKKAWGSAAMAKEYIRHEKLMGSAFEFIITADDDHTGHALLDEAVTEVKRIEKKLTEFNDESETSLINRNAGKEPVEVSEETWLLLKRCIDISRLTGGTFDISSGLLKKLYKFNKETAELPNPETIASILQKTGYKKIKLWPGNKVSLQTAGMHIGFGAIGKGYAADKVKVLMKQRGVTSGVINASGDLAAWGLRPDGEPWKTGIAHPADPSSIICWLYINDRAIATSGNYEQFFETNGTRYSHNIDPKTGYPVQLIKSVTVVSPAAELSDALATAVTIAGVRNGIQLINQLPDTHCIIVDADDKVYHSKNIDIHATV
jgi:FAD:protein FMN transferase